MRTNKARPSRVSLICLSNLQLVPVSTHEFKRPENRKGLFVGKCEQSGFVKPFHNKSTGWLHPTWSALARIWTASAPSTIILFVSLLWSGWRFKEEDLALSVVIWWIEELDTYLAKNIHNTALMCGPYSTFFLSFLLSFSVLH